jgi:hypothetical protein
MGRPKGSRNKKKTGAEPETQSLDEAKAQGERNVAEMVRKASGPVERGRHKRKLPCKVDHSVIEHAAEEMANFVTASENLKSEKREALADFRERRSAIDEGLQRLAGIVNGGTELLDVEVIVFLLPTNEIRVVRADTGEVVETRTATPEELQETLPVNGEPAPLDRDYSQDCHEAELKLVHGTKLSGYAKCALPKGHDGHHFAEFGDTSGTVKQEFAPGDEYDTLTHKLVEREDPILPDSALEHEVDAQKLLDDLSRDEASDHPPAGE